jgi:phosphoglucomutase
MTARLSPLAGKLAPLAMLVDVPRLVTAYYTIEPDPGVAAQRVAFGTSGHRGSSLTASFNERHVLAITQAICRWRAKNGIHGPLFLGIDTHALSEPAAASALEVLAANGVDVMLAAGDEYTPTPAVSHAILVHNRRRASGLADGIVVTPSHNPPDNGGFKYNPPHGGPAGTDVTAWIEAQANAMLEGAHADIKRLPHARALRASTTHRHDYLGTYVADLGNVIDFDAIRAGKLRLGVDPLGGAGVHYWARMAEDHRLDLKVVSEQVDATFRFMTVDWDGKIRMDPSSPYAMRRLLDMKGSFDIAFACDTDHDRHGIVTPSGLVPPNDYLAVCIDYLFRHRPHWGAKAAVGKTVVSTRLIDLVAQRLGRALFEVPVGFKWFVDGLLAGALGFGGEESAGAAFLRRDGTAWTTDKDGIVPALLAAEMTARTGRDPTRLHAELAEALGKSVSDRIDARATPEQKKRLAELKAEQLGATELAGEPIEAVLDRAPGNDQPIGGIKVIARSGWFAARPSGTEDIYKIYAESFRDDDHLQRVLSEAQAVVDRAIGSTPGS